MSKVEDIDHGFKAFFENAKLIGADNYAKIGVLGNSDRGGLHEKGPDGKASPLTVAEIAAVQEFGTKDGHIPSRSFVRKTFDEMKDELVKDAEKLVLKILDGQMTVDKALSILGMKLATGMRKKITSGDGIPPPNAPSTVKAKGSSRPLVDTGRLIGAISYAVVLAGKEAAAKYVSKSGDKAKQKKG